MLLNQSITTEYFCLFLSMVLLGLMLYTRPRVTSIFVINFVGTLVSIFTIVVSNYIISFSHKYYKNSYYSYVYMLIASMIYLVLYFVLLNCIFFYVAKLALNRRGHRQEQEKMILTYAAIYFGAAAIAYAKGGMIIELEDRVDVNGFMNFYMVAGLVCAVLVIIGTLLNRKNMSKTVVIEILLFTPIEMAIILLQFYYRKTIFYSTTYVAPLMLFYVLFHSNPFDEATGCQNVYAFDSMLSSLLYRKKKFILIQLEYPQLYRAFSTEMRRNIMQIISGLVREVEAFDKHVRIYRLSLGRFILLRPYNNAEEVDSLYNYMVYILNKSVSYGENVTYGKMICFTNFGYIKNETEVHAYLDYITGKMSKSPEIETFKAISQTEADFIEEREIAIALENIASQFDIDDPRVLCYAQPIYNVESKRFCTAEALMRLRVGGKLIPPLKFIPIAEENEFIHKLTCIMLNKICKEVETISNRFEFDTITFNCSPKELSDANLCQDFINIISKYNIEPGKISIELTENAMVESYEAIKVNMSRLEKAGISFYLDDFGSGYSNIERIISCEFKTIKFDKTLLYRALDNEITDDLVTSMHDILKKIGMTTLVEGVENEQQSDYCIRRGFDYIQGYKYARPEPIEELPNYFSVKH